MTNSRKVHRPLGTTGIVVPPICFGSAALGNVGRVIPEQSKLEICGEWFRGASPPVWIDADYRHGEGMALEVLGRMLGRLDVASEEVVITVRLGEDANGIDAAACWERSCRLLGDAYRPKLVSVSDTNHAALQTATQLKAAGLVKCLGIVISNLHDRPHDAADRVSAAEPDWVQLTGGFTVMRQHPTTVALLEELATQQIPVVLSGVFEGGFLVGGNHVDGRTVSAENSDHRALFAWRKAFVALCDGHGLRPAHACLQFALSAPGAAAVRIESSYADRVAENIQSVHQGVPGNFWDSMKEEGLLREGYLL